MGIDVRTLGQVAYEAYNESKGGLTWDGKPIPKWSELTGETGEAVKKGWEAAADICGAAYVEKLLAFRQEEGAITLLGHVRRFLMKLRDGRVALKEHVKARNCACAVTKIEEAEMWLERKEG